MTKTNLRFLFMVAVSAIGFLVSPMTGAAAAQDAAETAIILSGTGQGQARAAKSLGSSAAGSIGRAANAVSITQSQRSSPRRSRKRKGGHFSIALPADVDPLEGTDAPSYLLDNGSTIRVSGGLRRTFAIISDRNLPGS
ncbi:hypothetical protein [Marinobacter alexandrii]|uniref:hypothetical protein n=1 Tax=Marinobacter alexandrii TaxID=2570351 RepID=UPI003296BCFF